MHLIDSGDGGVLSFVRMAGAVAARTLAIVLLAVLLVLPLRIDAGETREPEAIPCTGTTLTVIDAAEFTVLKRVELHGDRFTAWISYGVTADHLRRAVGAKLSDVWPLAYQLDDSPETSLKSFAPITETTVAVTFSHLKPTWHRLTVGLVNRDGQLTQENAYCFSAPGEFMFARRNSL